MTQDNTRTSSTVRSGPPWPFIFILAAVLIPIVAAYVAYYTGLGVSDETVNEGVLLEPPVTAAKLLEVANAGEGGQLPDLDERQWRILVPVTAPCDGACANHLYLTRQVHIRLGEKALRVERYAVNLGDEEGAAHLAEIADEHPHLEHFEVSPEDWRAWLAETNAPADLSGEHYYLLVDQEGYAMMYYTTEHTGNQLLDDIKRLLRYTPE